MQVHYHKGMRKNNFSMLRIDLLVCLQSFPAIYTGGLGASLVSLRGVQMRMPRFRVRTLMLAVGVVALVIWGAMMGIRSFYYYRLASFYSLQERGWREGEARARGNPSRSRSIEAVYGPRMAKYYAPLAEKYRRAMWRPWTPVAPDPHAPGFDEWVEQERRAKEAARNALAPGFSPPQTK